MFIVKIRASDVAEYFYVCEERPSKESIDARMLEILSQEGLDPEELEERSESCSVQITEVVDDTEVNQ